jgi:hypothetical protein
VCPSPPPQLAALGFCAVYDQLMEGFAQADSKDAIFKCVCARARAGKPASHTRASCGRARVRGDPNKGHLRARCCRLPPAAEAVLTHPAACAPPSAPPFRAFIKALDENPEQYRKDATALTAAATAAGGVDGIASSEALSAVKARASAGTLVYSKFIAIGLFRMLELAAATEPAALSKLADAAGVPLAKVNADLTLYKGLLSKLAAVKELMAEMLSRDKKKTEARLAEKAQKEAGSASSA